MQNKIICLPNDVIARVAAGEVIEHPATVIKELIENALDAKATSIVIDVEEAGLKKIRVIDNGCGMSEEDLNNCFQRYTTSKIRTFEDLSNLSSFGFRGEALHSITTISNVIIRTKLPKQLHGFEIAINSGKASKTVPIGMPDGTEIIVCDLFVNLPARKIYMEQQGPEYKKILQSVLDLSLCNVSVGFTFKHNGKIILQLPKNQTLKARLCNILDEETVVEMLDIEHKSNGLSISGLITKPQHAFPNKDNQYLYLNGRYVKQRDVALKIRDAFGSLLDAKSYPAYALFIEMPPHLVDANVHPRKTYIQIQNENEVLEEITKVISQTLIKNDLTYKVSTSEDFTEFENFINTRKQGNKHVADTLKKTTDVWNIKTNSMDTEQEILQVHNLYLITQTPQGIVMIDQHAAHERILYEMFLDQFTKEKNKHETIEVEHIVNLPIVLGMQAELNRNDLMEIGIEFESFGKNTYKITKIPKLIQKHDIKKLLLELLADLKKASDDNFIDNTTQKTIAYLSCRTAIKSGDYLTQEERKNLLQKLAQTKTNYTCPHGRPVKVEITNTELKKLFKRLPN